MKILKADLALGIQQAEQTRERFGDGGLAGAVRAENIGEIAEIDCRRFRTEGLKMLSRNVVIIIGVRSPSSLHRC